MAEGTQEKVRTHRRGKASLSGRVEEEGRATIGNSLFQSVHIPTGLEGGGGSTEAVGGEKPFACLREIRRFLCRLPVARHLLCGLRA